MSEQGNNCYDGEGEGLLPDGSIPGQFPTPENAAEPPPAVVRGDNPFPIDSIAYRCYQDAVPLPLNPDGSIPASLVKPLTEPPVITPEQDPRQIIAGLVERCYPDLVPDITPPDDIDVPVFPPIIPEDWKKTFCELAPDVCNSLPRIDVFPSILLPKYPIVEFDDCKKVYILRKNAKVERLADKITDIDGRKKSVYRVTIEHTFETQEKVYPGDELICDDDDDGQPRREGYEQCVKDALDCLFRPYALGTWRPPKASCSQVTYPTGWYGDGREICIKNCVPERVPVYEFTKSGSPGRNVTFSPFTEPGYKHNDWFNTTRQDGTWDGTKGFSIGGNKVFNDTSTITTTTSFGGITFTIVAKGVKDGSNDFDSLWYVYADDDLSDLDLGDEWETTLTGPRGSTTIKFRVTQGSNTNHQYSGIQSPPAGYEETCDRAAFWLLKNQETNSVPVYKYYSSSWDDTLLTINPEIDSDMIENGGFVNEGVIGYTGIEKRDMIPWLTEDERSAIVKRYVSGISQVSVTFQENNGIELVVEGGSATVKLKFSWDDNPNTAGQATNSVSVAGETFDQDGERGSESATVTLTQGTYSVNVNGNSGGYEVKDTSIGFYDNDGDDENAVLYIDQIISSTPAPPGDGGVDHYFSRCRVTGGISYNLNSRTICIPSSPQAALEILYETRRPSASYENSWGYVFYNEAGTAPERGYIIRANVNTRGIIASETIPLDRLLDYSCRKMGFFILPDGNGQNSISDGDEVTFSEANRDEGGYTCNFNTAEENWVFFSDVRINPRLNDKRKHFVKIRGTEKNEFQYWEDLYDGDDDFSDFIVQTNVVWRQGSYKDDGVAFPAFPTDRPDPVMFKLGVKDECDPRLFAQIPKDPFLQKDRCGSVKPTLNTTGESPYECGKCRGSIVKAIDTDQEFRCIKSGRFSLRSMGCLVPTENDECLVWRMRLERNGTTIWQFISSAGDFPRIGTRLQSEERKTRGGRIFDCEAGDVFRLVIEDIIAGSVYSGVRPDIGIYDDDANKFEGIFGIQLQTSAEDTVVTMNRDVQAKFLDNGDLKVIRGGGDITLSLEWDDDPNTAGTALGTVTYPGGFSVTQTPGVEKGRVSDTFTVNVQNSPIPITVTGNPNGFKKRDDNSLCFFDGDGKDCNATLRIEKIENKDYSITLTRAGDPITINQNDDGSGSINQLKLCYWNPKVKKWKVDTREGNADEEGITVWSGGLQGIQVATEPLLEYFENGLTPYAYAFSDSLTTINQFHEYLPGGVNPLQPVSDSNPRQGYIIAGSANYNFNRLLGVGDGLVWSDGRFHDVNNVADKFSQTNTFFQGDVRGSVSTSRTAYVNSWVVQAYPNTAPEQIYADVNQSGWDAGSRVDNYTNYHHSVFLQDYYLINDMESFDFTAVNRYAKIRVAIIPRWYKPINKDSYKRGSWVLQIEIVDVLNAGYDYQEGQSFELYWPPKRSDKFRENRVLSPFYPDQDPPAEGYPGTTEINSASYTEKRGTRRRRGNQMFYQESHNKNSKVWFLGKDSDDHHVKFKVTIGSVS